LSRYLEGLNPAQREAVLYSGGPLLVVAGAGSGKTRVLTHRIARIVEGGVAPWRILAITFTNKAADEMRRRVADLVGEDAKRMWVSTFHSACVRILRANAGRIGYSSSFAIYDDADCRRLVEHILDGLGIDPKRLPPRAVLGAIGQAKGELLDPVAYEAVARTLIERRTAEVYAIYERRMREANAMDFDDLLSYTARLFRDATDVLEQYQERFVHLLVDEYQDTNHVQNELVLMLGRKHRNVCVVGDSDQSIYRFRGADMRNLLDFEKAFPDAHTIVLDQNYRSTGHILKAANAVIGNNLERKEKVLWSALGEGEPVRRYRAGDERDEATFVANELATLHRSAAVRYGDMAVFYRTNSQSRPIEAALSDRGIPYKVVGGTGFYERREIRDVLGYLRAVANPDDEVSLRRIVNVPRRGVGDASVSKVASYAASQGIGFGRALESAEAAGVSGKALAGIKEVLGLLDEMRSMAVLSGPRALEAEMFDLDAPAFAPPPAQAPAPASAPETGQLSFGMEEAPRVGPAKLIEHLLERTGYVRLLEAEQSIEADGRIENIYELASAATEFEDLESFLQTTALVSAADELDDDDSHVALMTLHTAKGLEFKVVLLTGLEEELFPHSRSLGEPADIEEERRLCYVGITRAREILYLTHAWTRSVFGMTRDSLPSRFLKEIPESLVDDVGGGALIGSGRGGDGRMRGSGQSWPQRRPATPMASTGAETLGLAAGDRIVHARWGEGRIVSVRGEGDKAEATIRFPRVGDKQFLLAATPLKRA
jgi:DNA helicase II / ATP-dependent DNA helicase PcrA